MPPPELAPGTATASSPQCSHTTPALSAIATRAPSTPTRAAQLPHPQHQTPVHLNSGRRLQRQPSLPLAVAVDASIPDRPNYATDEWARTHLSYFDTHGLTKDDIEIGMQTILNHLGAHPMSIPIDGLTIVHGTGLHSVTPYDPPSAQWITEYLANHPAAFDFATLTNPGMPAPYAIRISNVMLTLAVTCFHAPAGDGPPDVDPDLRLITLPQCPDGDSTDVAPTLPAASGTASDAPRTNNRIHSVTSSTDKCNPYLPPNTSPQPPVPIVPASSSTPDLRVTLSDTMIPRRSPASTNRACAVRCRRCPAPVPQHDRNSNCHAARRARRGGSQPCTHRS